MSEAVENLSVLISNEGDGTEFFVRNYLTQDIDTLFRGGLPGGWTKSVGPVRRARG